MFLTNYNTKDFDMHKDLQLLISAERKHKRELQELRELRTKIMTHKTPDQKLLGLIDADLKKYTEQP